MPVEQTSSTLPGLVPGPNTLLETQMLGTMIAAALYGIVLTLSFDCFKLLFKKNVTVPSRPMRRFLVFLILTMFLLSTLSLVQGVLVSTTSIFQGISFPSLPGGAPYVLPFSIWTADAFMLWRCAILYQGIPRLARIALLCFISLVFVAALASGLLLFFTFSASWMRLPTLLIVSFSTLFNVIVSVLIVVRLIYHQIYLRNVLGPGHGSPYTRIMAMTVESASLLILVGIPYVFLVAYQDTAGSMMLLSLLPQICAISTLLIVYRVADGRAAMEMPSGDFDGKHLEGHLGSLRFDKTRSISLSSVYLPDLYEFDPKKSPGLP
ncbi:hypothetical protein GALMADRAFT_144837 [Galerina marginata CBS 339.88]|uniref:G-protein coupled receptors family 1 profile domain-containing protein n=1 Tax=Galerina marginata (strain CBS 339.88) TaxID=685588 RepID=A0A067SJF9_GALM3|nr:hypothetical protein GALMADRAFT_144837 [Galerina marginata CBS 339.88]